MLVNIDALFSGLVHDLCIEQSFFTKQNSPNNRGGVLLDSDSVSDMVGGESDGMENFVVCPLKICEDEEGMVMETLDLAGEKNDNMELELLENLLSVSWDSELYRVGRAMQWKWKVMRALLVIHFFLSQLLDYEARTELRFGVRDGSPANLPLRIFV